MDRNRSKVIMRIVAVFFLVIAGVVWIYGQGSHRGLDAVIVGIAGVALFIFSFFIYRNTKKHV